MSSDAEKISYESADKILRAWLEYYEVDRADVEDKAQGRALDAAMLKVRKGIQSGKLIIAEDFKSITINLPNDQTLTCRELDGKAKAEMGKADETDHHGKAYRLMAALCGVPVSAILNLKGADLSRLEMLGCLFLAV